MNISLKPYTDKYSDIWQEIVSNYGCLFHDIRWKYIIEESYNLESKYFIIFNNTDVIGLAPFFKVRNGLMSLPYLPYAGIVNVTGNDFAAKVYSGLAEGGAKLNVRSKSTVPAEQLEPTNYVTMIKELNEPVDETFNHFNKKQRNMIRKASEYDFAVADTDVEGFYKIYLRATNNLGTPGHRLSFFKNIAKHFKNDVKITLLLHKGSAIGTSLEIDYAGTRYDPWAFSLKEYFQYKPNVFLYWESLQEAINKGLKYYDFGRSNFEGGTYHFKLSWGAQPKPLEYNEFQSVNNKLVSNPITYSQKSLLPSIWSKCPQIFTNTLGPYLRKYIY